MVRKKGDTMEDTQRQEEPEQEPEPFNPNKHLMQISGKDYLPVQWRLVWFREQFPQGTIDTEELVVDLDREVEEEVWTFDKEKKRSVKSIKCARGYARFRAVVTNGLGGRATGTKSENAASFQDYVEKAETGSIGRALAGLGFGTQWTGDEFDEKYRIVDAPVEHSSSPTEASSASTQSTPMATEQQLASIRKFRQEVGKPVPEGEEKLTYQEAKALITTLSNEYKEKHPEPKKAEVTLDIQAAIARLFRTVTASESEPITGVRAAD